MKNPWNLSPRECQVCEALVDGSVKTIARQLNIKPDTVRHYTECIFQKMGVNKRAKAAVLYDRWKGGRLES